MLSTPEQPKKKGTKEMPQCEAEKTKALFHPLQHYNVQMKASTSAVQIHLLYRATCTSQEVTSWNKHLNESGLNSAQFNPVAK